MTGSTSIEQISSAARQADLDVERFISEVESRRPLWDTSSEGYMDKARKHHLWQELTALFTDDWYTLDYHDRHARVSALQKRWKNLRDRFRKELQIQTSQEKLGNEVKKKRKYIYYEQLRFLKHAIDFRETRKNMDNTPWDLTDRRNSKNGANFDKDLCDRLSTTNSSNGNMSIGANLWEVATETPSSWDRQRTITRAHDPLAGSAWPTLVADRQGTSSSDRDNEEDDNEPDEDGDLLFLKSLAKDLRRMDPVTKLMVKKGMLETVTGALKMTTEGRFPPTPHQYYPLLHQFLHHWQYYTQQQIDAKQNSP